MINANELRVGNIVKDRGGKTIRIDWFENDKACMRQILHGTEVHPMTEYFEYLQPIELSPEVLEKCGFVNENIKMSGCNIWHFGDWRIAKSFTREEGNFHLFHKRVSPPTWSLAEIKHLHQLQNLYYALTQTELKIEL